MCDDCVFASGDGVRRRARREAGKVTNALSPVPRVCNLFALQCVCIVMGSCVSSTGEKRPRTETWKAGGWNSSNHNGAKCFKCKGKGHFAKDCKKSW